MLNKFIPIAALFGVVLMLAAFTAPAVAAPPPEPEIMPMATLTAYKPWKSGGTVYYAAGSGSSTALKASLRWQISGPDQTMATVNLVGTYVQGSKICDWGTPRDRILYTRANSSSGQVDSATLWTTSSGSKC